MTLGLRMPVVIIALVALAVTPIIVGGREFDSIVQTWHWIDGHPEAAQAKERCLGPDKTWQWDKTSRGDVAFCYDDESGRWVVIILAMAGSALVLITGYALRRGKTPQDWKNRPSNAGERR